jgi:hypothetical protein
MKPKLNEVVPVGAPRDRWRDACGAAAFASFLLIVAYVACPPIAGLNMPYSGGGAVVLVIGATMCLGLESTSARVASSIVLLGLMTLRALAPMRPDVFVAKDGELSTLDAGGLALLFLTAALMVWVAMRGSASGPHAMQPPTMSQAASAAERR